MFFECLRGLALYSNSSKVLRHFGKKILYLVELNNTSWEGCSRNRCGLLHCFYKGWKGRLAKEESLAPHTH